MTTTRPAQAAGERTNDRERIPGEVTELAFCHVGMANAPDAAVWDGP
jgi:hypothetical protein